MSPSLAGRPVSPMQAIDVSRRPEALELVRRLAFDAPSASFDAAFSTTS